MDREILIYIYIYIYTHYLFIHMYIYIHVIHDVVLFSRGRKVVLCWRDCFTCVCFSEKDLICHSTGWSKGLFIILFSCEIHALINSICLQIIAYRCCISSLEDVKSDQKSTGLITCLKMRAKVHTEM